MTANEVDAALALPRDEVGAALLAPREDQWFDRKGAQIEAKALGPPLVAFANAEGGVALVGLSNGKVQGLNKVAPKINQYRQAPFDFTNPPVRASFEQIPCINDEGESDEVLAIRIDPAERVHELKNGDCYLRIGDETRRLTFAQRQELEFDKGQSQFDGHAAPGVNMDDLDARALSDYKRAIGAASDITNLLRARSLLTLTSEITNAGILLFGKNPQIIFPQAHVRSFASCRAREERVHDSASRKGLIFASKAASRGLSRMQVSRSNALFLNVGLSMRADASKLSQSYHAMPG